MAKGQPEDQQEEAIRQRRLGDAAKMVPVLAAVLMMIPVLWVDGTAMSVALVYVFAVWAAMILLIAFLSRALTRHVRRPGERAPTRGAGR